MVVYLNRHVNADCPEHKQSHTQFYPNCQYLKCRKLQRPLYPLKIMVENVKVSSATVGMCVLPLNSYTEILTPKG